MKYAYVDSSVWIARFEGFPAYRKIVTSAQTALEQDGWKFCFSELVQLEVLLKPHRENQQFLIEAYSEAFAQALLLPNFGGVFKNAFGIAQTNSLKAMDAIHAAFAIGYGCELFVTTDADFRMFNKLPLHWIDLSQAAPS